tara:strand:+ start:2789 stop:3175 length:387 start_codon:yes stop_codon:yes gene_type:complete
VKRPADNSQEAPALAGSASIDRLAVYARLLDSQFRIPLTPIRIGLDGLIGLLPGVGDGVSFLFSLYPLSEAVKLGAGPVVIVKMLINVLVDFILGSIPFIGDLFDIGFKANIRNVRLLEEHLNMTRSS